MSPKPPAPSPVRGPDGARPHAEAKRAGDTGQPGLFHSEDTLQLAGNRLNEALADDGYHRALRRLLRALGARSALLCIGFDSSGASFIRSAVGVPRDSLTAYSAALPDSRSLVLAAIKNGRSREVSGSALNRYAEKCLLAGRAGVALSLPLLTGGVAFGGLLVCRDGRKAFTRQEMELAKAVSDQLAMTMENVALLQVLHRGKTEWEKTVDAIRDLVVILDLRGQIIRVNRAFSSAFRKPPQWMIGKNFFTLVYGRGAVPGNCPVRQTLQGGTGAEAEVQFNRLPGIYQVCTAALTSVDGDFAGAVVLARDMSAWIAVQRQLAQAEKLSAIGEMVAGVSHEINNPLTAILGYAELMLESTLPEQARADLVKLLAHAHRMQKIVQNLLRFSREDKPEMSLVDVNLVLSSALDLKAFELQSARIQVTDRRHPGLPLIFGNAGQLQQVFLNIINNAHQAMKTQQQPGSLQLETGLENGRLRIAISDSGPGIAREHLSRIFDPFFTTKPVGEGTGLGLSLSFGIIKEHGGSIRAECRSGRGATFIIELPLPGEVPGN